MKKLFFGAMCFALIGVGLTGCKKEQKLKPTNETSIDGQFNVSSNGKMLIFESVEDYQKIVENPSEKIKFDFLTKVSKMNHITYSEQLEILKTENDSLLGDDYLAQILNEDWIVQIGDYLYRVNKPEEKVYVLPVANINEYDDLVNQNKSNPNIRKFSTSDNVIELAEEGATGEKGLKCDEPGAGSRENYNDYKINTTIQISVTVYYRKFGIYFSNGVDVWNHVGNNEKLYIQAENLWAKKKCSTIYGPISFPWLSPSTASISRRTYTFYSGSTPLYGYHTKARARYENWDFPSGGNPYTVTFSGWAEIEINSPY